MRQHKFQKQNQVHSTSRPIEDKTINLLCSPQFEPYQKQNCSPSQIQAQQSQVTITPVFQQHRRASSLLQSTQRNTDRKVDVLSVLQMSFSGDESKRQGTATFKNTRTERSSVTSVCGRSRFVQSRLERKQAAFQIFQAIKQSQEQLEQRKKQIMKTFGFKPVKAEPKAPSKLYSLKDRML